MHSGVVLCDGFRVVRDKTFPWSQMFLQCLSKLNQLHLRKCDGENDFDE